MKMTKEQIIGRLVKDFEGRIRKEVYERFGAHPYYQIDMDSVRMDLYFSVVFPRTVENVKIEGFYR